MRANYSTAHTWQGKSAIHSGLDATSTFTHQNEYPVGTTSATTVTRSDLIPGITITTAAAHSHRLLVLTATQSALSTCYACLMTSTAKTPGNSPHMHSPSDKVHAFFTAKILQSSHHGGPETRLSGFLPRNVFVQSRQSSLPKVAIHIPCIHEPLPFSLYTTDAQTNFPPVSPSCPNHHQRPRQIHQENNKNILPNPPGITKRPNTPETRSTQILSRNR